jgi:hypothetical protein
LGFHCTLGKLWFLHLNIIPPSKFWLLYASLSLSLSLSLSVYLSIYLSLYLCTQMCAWAYCYVSADAWCGTWMSSSWLLNWLWWSAELATAIARLHSITFSCMGLHENMVFECRVDRREELFHCIFNASRHMNYPVLCRVTHSVIRRVRMYIQTDDGHFEHLLNRISFHPFSFFLFLFYVSFIIQKAYSDHLEFQISVAP